MAGLCTLAASIGFGRIPGLTACGPTGGAGPILAFELVRSPADMLALFGAEPCTSRLAAAQRAGLWLDCLGFIPAYTAFLALGAWAARGADRRLALAAVAALVVAGLSDEVEGVIMFRLLDGFPGDPGLFGPLFWAVHVKFALLGVGALLIALLLWRGGSWLARIAALLAAFGGVVSLALLLTDPRAPLMMEGHRYAWTALLIAALAGAVRPALVARRAG